MTANLKLPERTSKPRQNGLTVVIDTGLPTSLFRDFVASHADLIDFVKFGWGTALVTSQIRQKIDAVAAHDVGFFFGGTMLEKFILQNKADDFFLFAKDHGAKFVEISDGSIELSVEDKLAIIERAADEFTVLSEVGFKDQERSGNFYPAQWVAAIKREMAAGASYVILEARESGQSGICRPSGEVRIGLIEEIVGVDSDIDQNTLIFETPNKTLQTYFIRRFGANVNLANIAMEDVIALETLRQGLRFDTMLDDFAVMA